MLDFKLGFRVGVEGSGFLRQELWWFSFFRFSVFGRRVMTVFFVSCLS